MSLYFQMNSTGNKRAPTTATQRLKQDYLRIKKDPVPYICAEPLPSNILEWYGILFPPLHQRHCEHILWYLTLVNRIVALSCMFHFNKQ